ncbi:hypothetical protein Tco_0538610 [Tanacetum coccineum]
MDDSLERAATTATSLDAKQDRGNINKTQSKATPNEAGSQGTTLGGGPRRQETMGDTIAQTSEDSLKLNELMELCTILQQTVLDLETTKTTQANEIASLKRRVKKLERRNKSRTHGLKRIYRVSLSRRVESSEYKGLGEEDASKQGRIADIDANKYIYLVNVHTDEDMFDVNDLDGDEPVVEQVKPMKRLEQMRLDEELSFKLQAEEEEERLAREKAHQTEEANIAWDDIQAKIEVDYQLDQRLQAQEQEELTDEEKEATKMKELMDIVPDEEEVAIDAIPLDTKPPSIVDWKIIKEGKINNFQIIRADGSLKRYSSFIQMLKSFNREDLETLWKLVKAKHGSTRPEEGCERVLWEKKYPLTPATITEMLNKKLQADHWNEMCYQLLKLIIKQLKNQRSVWKHPHGD